jgi:hypothetical protein
LKFTAGALALSLLIAGSAAFGFGQPKPYRSDFVSCHDISLEVDGPMTIEDWREIIKRPVQSVHTLGDADPSLFENPKNLKSVREIILISSSTNAKALGDIANNFPNLEELAVSQTAPLTEADMRNVDRLNELFFLEICTEMPSCSSFAAAIPPKLKRLLLENTRVVSSPTCRLSLPVLTYFGLRRSKLSKGFVDGLDAPNLEEVSLSRVLAEPGAFQSFAKFPKLKRVFAYNMPHASIVELDLLQQACPRMKVVLADSSAH